MRKRVVVKTVSPVHIGGKTQELTPLEAVINQGYCYVVDESRLGRALLEEGMMDRLYGEIDRKGRNFRLERFLQQVKLLNKEFLEKKCRLQLSHPAAFHSQSFAAICKGCMGLSFYSGFFH